MARYVGNMLGPVNTVDFDEQANMVEFVRVRIDWNVDSPLRFQRNFQFIAGENTVIKYRFERLQNFCSKCGSLKHDVKDCGLSFDDNDDPHGPMDDDAPNENDNPQMNNNATVDESDAETLETIDPPGYIPGLQANQYQATTNEVLASSSIPSVFEDTELTAERLRYIHGKYTCDHTTKKLSTEFIIDVNDSGESPVLRKRKQRNMETYYQQCEAAEDQAVLCQIKKRERVESEGSCSITNEIDRGAESPVPPKAI